MYTGETRAGKESDGYEWKGNAGKPKRRWSDCNREDLESIGAVATDERSEGEILCAPATPRQWEQASQR